MLIAFNFVKQAAVGSVHSAFSQQLCIMFGNFCVVRMNLHCVVMPLLPCSGKSNKKINCWENQNCLENACVNCVGLKEKCAVGVKMSLNRVSDEQSCVLDSDVNRVCKDVNWFHFFVLFFIRAIFKLYIYIPTNCTQLIYFINNTLKHMYCLKL